MNTELQGSIASGDDFSDVVEVASQTLEGFGMTVDKNGKQLSSTKEMTVQTKKAVNTLAYSADVTSTSFQSLGIGCLMYRLQLIRRDSVCLKRQVPWVF